MRRDVRRISTRARVERGRGGGERRPVMGRRGAGSGRRAHDGVRCLVSSATSFAQGAGSSTPGRWRDPLKLGPWLPRAPCHAHRSLHAGCSTPGCRRAPPGLPQSSPERGELGTSPQASSASAAASSSFGRRKLLVAAPTRGARPSLHRRTSASSASCTGREAHPRGPCPWVVVVAFRKKNVDVWGGSREKYLDRLAQRNLSEGTERTSPSISDCEM
jgi:hypothetical protein